MVLPITIFRFACIVLTTSACQWTMQQLLEQNGTKCLIQAATPAVFSSIAQAPSAYIYVILPKQGFQSLSLAG
jgi:hypothetical protein